MFEVYWYNCQGKSYEKQPRRLPQWTLHYTYGTVNSNCVEPELTKIWSGACGVRRPYRYTPGTWWTV